MLGQVGSHVLLFGGDQCQRNNDRTLPIPSLRQNPEQRMDVRGREGVSKLLRQLAYSRATVKWSLAIHLPSPLWYSGMIPAHGQHVQCNTKHFRTHSHADRYTHAPSVDLHVAPA